MFRYSRLLSERLPFNFCSVKARRCALMFADASGVVVGEPRTFAQRPAFEMQAHHRGRERIAGANCIHDTSRHTGFGEGFRWEERVAFFVALFPLAVDVTSVIASRHNRSTRLEWPHHAFDETGEHIVPEEVK